MFRRSLAFLAAAILATATLYAVPPPRPLVHLDVKSCAAVAGWSFDPLNSSASTTVTLYEGDMIVDEMVAGLPSPDVDAHFGITGAHRFHFVTANIWILNDGEPHTLRVEAGGSSLTDQEKADRSFTIMCGTPTVIAGDIQSEMGWDLSSAGLFGGRLTLNRVYPDREDEYVNSTDCWSGQGCVNDGHFVFTRGYAGRFHDGDYCLVAEADAHLPSAETCFVIANGAVQDALPTIVLPVAPIYTRVLSVSSFIPPGGGWAKVRLGVWNLNWNRLELGDYALASITVGGPTRTTTYTTTPTWDSFPVPMEVGDYAERTVRVWFSSDRPNRKSYWMDIRSGSPLNYEDIFSQVSASVVKGVVPPFGGGSESPVSSPAAAAKGELLASYFAALKKK